MAELFGCSVADLLDRVSSHEIMEWGAYFKVKNERQKQEMQKHKSMNKARRMRR